MTSDIPLSTLFYHLLHFTTENCTVSTFITLMSILILSSLGKFLHLPTLHTSHSFSTGSSSALLHWYSLVSSLIRLFVDALPLSQSQCFVPQNPQGSNQYLMPSQTLSLGRLIILAFLSLCLLLFLRLITLACIVQ